jgi:hypothetical protein
MLRSDSRVSTDVASRAVRDYQSGQTIPQMCCILDNKPPKNPGNRSDCQKDELRTTFQRSGGIQEPTRISVPQVRRLLLGFATSIASGPTQRRFKHHRDLYTPYDYTALRSSLDSTNMRIAVTGTSPHLETVQ